MIDVEAIIRAWKNEHYRQELSDADRALIPSNPAGRSEIADEELSSVSDSPPSYYPSCNPCTYNCD
ncbi:MAG TPA: mersacidin/lichenicidin family type 2 lantibiotic [Herpetosiphonaceae bacterium]